MKHFWALLLTALCCLPAVAQTQKPGVRTSAEMMRQLRLTWLTQPPPQPGTDKDEIIAVLMDWPLRTATATILASSAGDSSLYTTSAFGIIGGISHEGAKKAALALVDCARRHQALASPTKDFSYASPNTVRFFFVSRSGVRSVGFDFDAVQKTGSDAADLYDHAQVVMTELRQVMEEQHKQ
jgi:hypothetical protein